MQSPYKQNKETKYHAKTILHYNLGCNDNVGVDGFSCYFYACQSPYDL